MQTKAMSTGFSLASCCASVICSARAGTGSPPVLRVPRTRNAAGRPADLNNIVFRLILPVLNRCEVCKEPESVHGTDVDHKYKRDASLPEWHGWHAFRRGLASNLYRLGVSDKAIQAILRHADVNTTMKCYVKTTRPDVKAGMEKFEADLENRLLDSNRTVKATLTASERPV